MKKVAILYTKHSPVMDAIKYQLNNCEVDCITTPNNKKYDLVILSNYTSEYSEEALKVQYSLLPAFDTKEPLRDALLAGVKLTGITILLNKSKKILAQYPVFVKNDMNYNELEKQLHYLEQILMPYVAQKYINNEQIDITELLNTGCSSNCSGGCGSCNH